MREILFKGKRVDNGEWVYGYYSFDNRHTSRGTYITYYFGYSQLDYEVIPETVGQYTGLTDKNNRKIFEGDIVRQNNEIGKILYESNYCTFAVILKRNSDLFQHLEYECEIIGNIFDNPELIKE